MKLDLYYYDACPFCRMVLSYIDKAGLRENINFKDTMISMANRKELIAIGGKTQVPCLVIDGKPMYESMDIIEFLKSNFEE